MRGFILATLFLAVTAWADRVVVLDVSPSDNSLNTAYPLGNKPGSDKGEYRFTTTGATTAESVTTCRTQLERVDGNDDAVTVEIYDTGTGTASTPSDYSISTSMPVTVSWADGVDGPDTTDCIDFTINDVTGDQTVILGLQNPTAGFTADSIQQTYTLTIQDAGAPAGNDDEFGIGSVVQGAACPGIPTSFNATHQVTSSADFTTEYAGAACGDALILSSAFSWSNEDNLSKDCTANNPIYILGYDPATEGIYPRTHTGSVDLDVSGDYHIIAGIHFANAGRQEIQGKGIKFLCNKFTGQSNPSGVVYTPAGSVNADDAELAYNLIDDPDGPFPHINNCDQSQPSCTDMPTDWHIHHNTYQNKAAPVGNHDGIKTGSDRFYPDSVTTYHSPGGNTFHKIENNLFDGFRIGEEIISIKSSGALIRWNCVLDGGNTTALVNRMGDKNVIYGNWFGEMKQGGLRISGRDNIVGYNYFRSSGAGAAIRLHPGVVNTANNSHYYYREASDNIVRRNVWSNVNYMVETMPRFTSGTASFIESPQGNNIADNEFHSNTLVGTTIATSYLNSDSNWNSTQFCANNTCGSQTTGSSSLAESTCGNSGLFTGPTGGSAITVPDDAEYHPDIRNITISAPSWW